MAITIQDQPSANVFQSVGNPIELLISSNNTAQPNFKFYVSIYYEPSGVNTLLAVLKYDLIPSTTQALVNISQIASSKIAENIINLRTSASGIKNETLKFHRVNVICQDYYGTIPAVVASGSATSNTLLYFNGALKYQGWVNDDLDLYKIASASLANTLTQKILTGFDNGIPTLQTTVNASLATYFKGSNNIRKIKSSQLAQLSYLWQGTGGTNSKVSLFAYKTDLSASITVVPSLASVQGLQSLNFGSAALIALGGTMAGLNSTYTFLSLAVTNNTYQLTQTYLFEIEWTDCSRFESYEIHWLNRYGGWDSWVFNKRSRHTTEIERQSYNPTFLPISGSSIVRNSYDITGKNFIVSTKESYIVNSDNLKQWELEGLEDLITSPMVYWKSANGFVNISVKDPNVFEHKTNTVDKLFNLSFSFEIDNQDRRQ
jgi:hypothetical protein